MIPNVEGEKRQTPEYAIQEELELGGAISDLREILEEKGLDPFPTHFEFVSPEQIHEFTAYGIPGTFSHWTRGAEYYKQKTRHDYGLEKIYEMVINTNPSLAFLQASNNPIQNKLVIAHVFGHTDFFKLNISFSGTDRQMVETADVQATRIRKYEFEHGKGAVEEFLDAALSIELNIEETRDPRRWTSPEEYRQLDRERFEARQKAKTHPSSPYDDIFDIGEKREEPKTERPPFPAEEEGNLLLFLALHSRILEEWQRDILFIVHAEKQYFRAQALTKIMNEGWASYWHVQGLREYGERGGLTPGEELEWPSLHAGVIAPNKRRINPYYLGYYMWEDIARRGTGLPLPGGEKEYDFRGEEQDPEQFKGAPDFDIFWVRENMPSDQAFVRKYLTPSLVKRLELYTYAFDGHDWIITEKDPMIIRDTLVNSMTNFGMPVIRIPEGGADYNGNSELYLVQKFEGTGINIERAKKTLLHIYRLWGRAVHVKAVEQLISEDGEMEERDVVLSCKDGKEVSIKVESQSKKKRR